MHSDHGGASFIPDHPFTPGETVTVTTSTPVTGASGGRFTYKVARPAVASRASQPPSPDPPEPPGTPAMLAPRTAAPSTQPSVSTPPTPSGPAGPYRSRPDLSPPKINTTVGTGVGQGLLLGTSDVSTNGVQQGSIIFDNTGQPVWFNPSSFPFDPQVITYKGQTALAYFQPASGGAPGINFGSEIVLDTAYRRIGTIQAGNGYTMESHGFQMSPDNTKALFTIFNLVNVDLSPYGGPSNGQAYEGIVQEVDIATGAVTFEWHSLGSLDFPLSDSYVALNTSPADYFHLNSVDYDTDGNFLFSARHVSVVAKLNSSTGALMWRMGGKRNQFTFTDGDGGPSWSHDVRREPDGTISVFDNGNGRNPPYSRGVDWAVNEATRTAHVANQWRQSPDVFAGYTGSNRQLPGGNQLIDWGNLGLVTEYANSQSVFEAQYPSSDWSYRVRRADWHATPARPPDMALDRSTTTATGYASWNGATEVATWQLWGGPDSQHLRLLGSAPRSGFETAISGPVQDTDEAFQVRAVNGTGQTIGESSVTVLAPPGAGVTTSAQVGVPNQTDMFDVNSDGAVEVRWVTGGGAWSGPLVISPPGLAPPGAHLAASPQFGVPNQTDVFVVGNDGATRVLWVDGAGRWNGPLSITPSGTAPPGASLATSNQFGLPNQTDVFVVGKDGASRVSWVESAGAWNGPLSVTPANTAPAGAELAASPQFGIGNQTDLFVVGNDGASRVSWVDGAGGWNGPLSITASGTAPAGAPLATSNQFGLPNQTDVFVVGNDGATRVSWVESAGAWNGPLSITPANNAPAGGHLDTSPQFGVPNQTDVFVVGNDGASRVSWVESAGAWNGPLSITPANNAPAGGHLAASNQFGLPNQTDVFVLGNAHVPGVSWVESAGGWQGPLHI